MRSWMLLALPLALVGCPKGKLPNLDQFKPTLKFNKVKVKDVNFQEMGVDFVFDLSNPNPIEVALASFSYDLGLGGSDFLKGANDDGVKLKAQSDSKLKIPVGIKFADVFKVASGIGDADEVPFTIKGDFGFNTPLGVIAIPYNETGKLPVIRAPKISLEGLRVGKLDILKGTAHLDLDLGLKSENKSNLDFKKFDYTLKLGGSKVAEGLVEALGTAGPEKKVVSLPIDLNLVNIGSTIVSALTKKEKLDVGLTAAADIATPLGLIPLSINESNKLQLK